MRTAGARRRVIQIAVVQVVVVCQFLTSRDIPGGNDPHATLDFIRLAIGIARVIDERRHAFTIDHMFAIHEPEQIGPGMVVVERVGFFDRDVRSRILHDEGALLDRSRGVATFRINLGLADDQVRWASGFSSGVTVELARRRSRHVVVV